MTQAEMPPSDHLAGTVVETSFPAPTAPEPVDTSGMTDSERLEALLQAVNIIGQQQQYMTNMVIDFARTFAQFGPMLENMGGGPMGGIMKMLMGGMKRG